MATKKVDTMGEAKEYRIIAEKRRNMGKTVEDRQLEKAVDDLEDLIIEVQGQLAHIKTSRIPAAENAVTRAERALERAQKEYEETKSNICKDLESYLKRWNAGEDNVKALERDLAHKKALVTVEQDSIVKYQAMLDYLTAKE